MVKKVRVALAKVILDSGLGKTGKGNFAQGKNGPR